MNIEIVDMITYIIVGLSIWCFSNITKNVKAIRSSLQENHQYDTEDVLSLVVSLILFCGMVFVLCVEPGLIHRLPSVFAASVVGAVFVLQYVTDLMKCKHKHHHIIHTSHKS